MSETINKLDTALSDLISKATETGPKIVDWLCVQVPDLVNEILIWNSAQSAIECVFGAFLVLVVPTLWWKFLARDHMFGSKKPRPEDGLWVLYGLGSIFTVVPSLIIGGHYVNFTWLKIYLAPKLYLLEYISALK
jgi:hypothetical protein